MNQRTIKQVGDEYCVFSADGKDKLGCHKTKEQAEAQLAAIEANKHKGAGEVARRTAAVEAAGEAEGRRIWFTVSDESADRYNTVIRVAGWDTRSFEKNPVFQWAHDPHSPPVGRVVQLVKEPNATPKPRMRALVEFADRETYPFADVIYRLYKGGFLRGTSVGFKTLKARQPIDEAEREALGLTKGGGFAPDPYILEENELFEISGVPIPGNANTLADEKANELGLSAEQVRSIHVGLNAPACDEGATLRAALEAVRNTLVGDTSREMDEETMPSQRIDEIAQEMAQIAEEADHASHPERLKALADELQEIAAAMHPEAEEEEEPMPSQAGMAAQLTELRQMNEQMKLMLGSTVTRADLEKLQAQIEELAQSVRATQAKSGPGGTSAKAGPKDDASYVERALSDSLEELLQIRNELHQDK